jgi:hypothetical protein
MAGGEAALLRGPTLLAAILYSDSSSRRMKSGSLFC